MSTKPTKELTESEKAIHARAAKEGITRAAAAQNLVGKLKADGKPVVEEPKE